jgi:hypothetical protein
MLLELFFLPIFMLIRDHWVVALTVFWCGVASPLLAFLLGIRRAGLLYVKACWAPLLGYAVVAMLLMKFSVIGYWTYLVVPVLGVALAAKFAKYWPEVVFQHNVALSSPTCTGCGYDLTGNVTGRCPECGRWVGFPVSRGSGLDEGPGPDQT